MLLVFLCMCCDRALCKSRRCVRNTSETYERRARCPFGAHETEISVTRNLFLFRGSISLSRVRFEIVRRCGIGCLSRRSRPGSPLLLLWYAFFRPFSFPFPYFLFFPPGFLTNVRCARVVVANRLNRKVQSELTERSDL